MHDGHVIHSIGHFGEGSEGASRAHARESVNGMLTGSKDTNLQVSQMGQVGEDGESGGAHWGVGCLNGRQGLETEERREQSLVLRTAAMVELEGDMSYGRVRDVEFLKETSETTSQVSTAPATPPHVDGKLFQDRGDQYMNWNKSDRAIDSERQGTQPRKKVRGRPELFESRPCAFVERNAPPM